MNNQNLTPDTKLTLTGWADERDNIKRTFSEQKYEFPLTAEVTDDVSDDNNAILQLPMQGKFDFTRWAIDWFKWAKQEA